jgi:hypothetical protein
VFGNHAVSIAGEPVVLINPDNSVHEGIRQLVKPHRLAALTAFLNPIELSA